MKTADRIHYNGDTTTVLQIDPAPDSVSCVENFFNKIIRRALRYSATVATAAFSF